MTEKVIINYDSKRRRHSEGTIMYRSLEEMEDDRKKLKTTSNLIWYKKKGFDLNIQVPLTQNQVLGKQLKSKLETVSNKKIMIQELCSQTVVGKMSKSNPCPPPKCHRQDCIPCLHGLTDSRCYTNNIGYVIVCQRSPCCDSINLDNKKLQTEELRLQLDKLNIDDARPAIYSGESWRSSYSRSKTH